MNAIDAMDEQELIERWSDVESWLLQEAHDLTRRRCLPATAAFTFHGGRASTIVTTPTFCAEDAELITDELCRFLPQLRADQLLVMWPATFGVEPDGMPSLWLLKAQLGDRAHGWRTLLYPLPFDRGDIPIEPVEAEVADAHDARIQGLFDVPVPPIHDTVLITPNDDRFTVYTHPGGPLARSTLLFSFN